MARQEGSGVSQQNNYYWCWQRMKPECQPGRGYPLGNWYVQWRGCSALSGYDYGCAVDGNGHDLLSARETSGHPAEAALIPEVPLAAVNPVSPGGPNVETSLSYLTPPDPLIQILTAVAFPPYFNTTE
ncbi:hypothetical protein MC885_010876 [Smutsia gigantea]|nr:hypothetical protein MC885_010876 [Smutsia gigantea]